MLFGRRGHRYQFNAETLQFEYRRRSFRSRLARTSFELLACVAGGVLIMLLVVYLVQPPFTTIYDQEQEALLHRAAMLDARVRSATARMAELESRDNNLYRTIFEADTIAEEMRVGGVGGVDRHAVLRRVSGGDRVRDLAVRLEQLGWRVYVQSKSFDEVSALAFEKDRLMHSIPAIQPVSVKDLTRVSSLFGYRRDPFTHQPRLHAGIDFVGPSGTPIYSTGDGIVITASYSSGGYGNQVVVDHGFGYKTRYAHLKEISVAEGGLLKRGQQVGTMGSTGRSTSTHLHYEVLVRNRPVNPLQYFNDMSEAEYEMMLANAEIQHLD